MIRFNIWGWNFHQSLPSNCNDDLVIPEHERNLLLWDEKKLQNCSECGTDICLVSTLFVLSVNTYSLRIWKHFFCPGIKWEVGVNILRFLRSYGPKKLKLSPKILVLLSPSGLGSWVPKVDIVRSQNLEWRSKDWINRKMPEFLKYLFFSGHLPLL